MSAPLLFIAGLGAGLLYMSLLAPPTVTAGVYTPRTLEGGRDVVDSWAGVDHQPPTSITSDVDQQTGLPIFWEHRANGTRTKRFTDSRGVSQDLPPSK